MLQSNGNDPDRAWVMEGVFLIWSVQLNFNCPGPHHATLYFMAVTQQYRLMIQETIWVVTWNPNLSDGKNFRISISRPGHIRMAITDKPSTHAAIIIYLRKYFQGPVFLIVYRAAGLMSASWCPWLICLLMNLWWQDQAMTPVASRATFIIKINWDKK